MAGIGSICNTLKDAQNLMMPITIIVIIPMMSSQVIIQNPDGMYAKAAIFFSACNVDGNGVEISAAGKISPVEISATIVFLILSVISSHLAGGKGLPHGRPDVWQKTTLREVAHWLRQR